ncbi:MULTISPECIES: flagellar hook capping FlgD N-terminal domain-containing protein [Citrobacter]|jgi:flagellar basal-body rod modification protein FlgD|uniref:Basal-body rod modification protein FlgD n=1 Tax=Citrobacter europaeus TaxID=1914243 RepID=A0ABY0JWG0_9ENTR|nr:MULTISPECIES: flagellar hook capping FlgD N-terminal domain-containing protein [Citrobacter]ARC41392.1 flagellar rod protein [Citrobacter braakii]AUT93845.1 flagellar rod protein [Citrobacter freundii]MDM3273003.1 flagellar rod protein [Citrobacter sp. Ce129]ROW34521.1 flagellar rod protein [Citrobacter europaeus]SBW28164.1 Flagellar basal-body rod modification protein FlgD [Citrobacter europaeus]
MNTLALYAQSQALASSSQKTSVAENNVGATTQSTNLGDSSSSAASSTTDTSDSSSTPTTTTSTETSAVDTFLTLFVAEIENQDPTDPTDPTAYIDQLSSMAQVAMMEEMSVQANTNAVLMSNIQVMALGNMVGDDIMVQTTSLDIEDNSQEIQGRVTLDDSCTDVDLHFTDEAGDDYTVSLIPEGETSVGPGQVDFDINPADYGIPPGDYSVSVVTNTGEEEVPIEVTGKVEDVRIPLDGSTPVLNVDGVGEVPFTMITQFGVPDSTDDTTPPDTDDGSDNADSNTVL